MENKMVLTVKEMAAMLNVSLPTAYELVHRDGFPTIRMGRKILINAEMLQHWLNEQTCKQAVM